MTLGLLCGIVEIQEQPMIKHCPTCRHIYDADEPHECPTPEYTAARNRLVNLAAQAEEEMTQEELECSTS